MLDVIATVDEIVHVEVHKLYPDADLPRFFVESNENGTLVMIYESQKKLEPFAHGLIDGCAEVFGEKVKTEYQTISETPHQAKFTIQLHHD
ncbi:MAG TPA: hypothetical protein ENK72_01205 [Epsilonproteobacteria bacterium]|nr:hypothetical protein [Campylobacterota bacterium]